MNILFVSGPLLLLVDAIASVLLLWPLVTLTRAGYDGRWWWRFSETDIFPFPTRLTVQAPIFLWYLAFWAVACLALVTSLSRGRIAELACLIGLAEAAYGILNAGRKTRPLGADAQPALVSFALGHNALTEEVLFRGAPLWIATAAGFGRIAAWQIIFILLTGLAFGFYHRWTGQASRFCDTTLFGCLLGVIAVWNGVASAVLVHLIHNARAIPLGQTDDSLPRWERNRAWYLMGLFTITGTRFGLAWWGVS